MPAIKKLDDIKSKLDRKLYEILKKEGIERLRPAQQKAVKAGLLNRKSVLVCTPTASGKTLVAEMAALNSIYKGIGKAIYIVPLKALANEKYREFKHKYGADVKIAVSIGDLDSTETRLAKYDFIITTSEKLDSLLRHCTPWLKEVGVIVIDEIHLLNDVSRGPTLEVLITLLKTMLNKVQLVALSATIGNPQELAGWLKTELIEDEWRPVKLYKGVALNNKIEFDSE